MTILAGLPDVILAIEVTRSARNCRLARAELRTLAPIRLAECEKYRSLRFKLAPDDDLKRALHEFSNDIRAEQSN